MLLSKKFYQRNTLKIAQELLGCVLVRKFGRRIIRAVITETEAYKGEKDLASHASKGRTPRTELMFGEAGRAYIYLIYGMYHCLNIVTEKKDYPAAVLIRGLANLSEWRADKREWVDIKNAPKLNGPGKVCRELKIDKQLNGWDLYEGEKLWIERPARIATQSIAGGPAQNFSKKNIMVDKRIGVDYAKHCQNYLWRFSLKEK